MTSKITLRVMAFIACISITAQAHAGIPQILFGMAIGAGLYEARAIGKKILRTPKNVVKQTVTQAAENLNQIVDAVTDKQPQSPKSEIIEILKREFTYLKAGVPVVACSTLDNAQYLIDELKKSLK